MRRRNAKKIKKVNLKINLKKKESFFITSPENIGWLGNIRILKNKFNKNLNCVAILEKNKFYIFTDHKITSKIKNIVLKIKMILSFACQNIRKFMQIKTILTFTI